jgi:hypothetical protein
LTISRKHHVFLVFLSVPDLTPHPKKKKFREQKLESELFSIGDETYGDVTVREGHYEHPALS